VTRPELHPRVPEASISSRPLSSNTAEYRGLALRCQGEEDG
jgi:hypothetical protein